MSNGKQIVTSERQNGMMFNDRRKTRIQSANERQRVNTLVNHTAGVLGNPSRKEMYARATEAVDIAVEANRKKK